MRSIVTITLLSALLVLGIGTVMLNEKINAVDDSLGRIGITTDDTDRLVHWVLSKQNIPEHLFNSDSSVEKCKELLDIGFYGIVGNVGTGKTNTPEEQISMYDDCVTIAKSINS